MSGLPHDLTTEREAIFEWAQGDPLLLSARCVKAEEENQQLRDLLRRCASYIESDIEGTDFEPRELIEARAILDGTA